MKKSFHYFFLLLVVVFGCDSLEDRAVIGIPIIFEEQFEVFTDTVGIPFSIRRIINATQNGDVAENVNNIKDYQIKSVKYLISNVITEGDSVITHGAISFSTIDTSKVVDFVQEDINLNELETPNEEQEVEYTSEQLAIIGEILKSGNQIYVEYTADIDTVASYNYKIIIDISMKVGI